MLGALRKSAGGFVAKIFIGLLVLSFAVWGIADIFGGGRGETLVEVGDTRISTEEYRQALDREVFQLSQQVGRPLTLQQARQFGVDQRVLSRLVTEAVLDETARELGLGASDQAIAQLIMQDPSFHGPSGQFDRGYFTQALRSAGLNEEAYVESQRSAVMRQHLAEGLVGANAVPDVMSDAIHRYMSERRTVESVTLGAGEAGEVPVPDEAALTEYFEENRAEFRAPEYRQLRLLILDAETLAEGLQIPEDEVRAAYEEDAERYRTPERRSIDQLIFPDRAAADAAYAEIESGTPFEDVAADNGLRPQDYQLGMRTRSQIVDPAIAEAAFSQEADIVGQPVDGRFGAVIVRVNEIEPEAVRPFEEVSDEVRRTLAMDRSRDELFRAYDTIEDAHAGGATLAEAASQVGLQMREIEAVDASGNAPDGTPVEGLPESPELLEQAFEAEVGVETPAIPLGDEGYAWVEVVDATPARERTLDEVREQLAERWREDEIRRRLAAEAEEIVSAVRDGRPLADVAADRGLEVASIGPFSRNEQAQGLSSAAVSAVFATPEGGVSSAPGADGPSRVVFRVAAVEVPARQETPAAQAEAIQQQIGSGLADDVLTQYVNRMRDAYGATINQTALNRVSGQS